MTTILIYLLLLKSTITTFNGPSSLPILREDFVLRWHLLSDRDLNAAVVAGRTAPGPMGIYVVSVGYFAGGIPGALAGWLAMLTPSFLIVPLLRYLGNSANHPRVKSVLNAVVLASVGLVLCSAQQLVNDSLSSKGPVAILLISFVLLVTTKIETVWIICGGAVAACLAKALS
jgi:chromate transporter